MSAVAEQPAVASTPEVAVEEKIVKEVEVKAASETVVATTEAVAVVEESTTATAAAVAVEEVAAAVPPPPSVAATAEKVAELKMSQPTTSPVKDSIDLTNATFFKAADGMQIYYNVWKPAADVTPKALVLAVHGLGEHIHRYDHVFSKYAEAGIVVKGIDYRGHGRTLKKNAGKAKPGFLGPFNLVWDDILALYKIEVDGVPAGLPTFVMGHSLGGLIALTFVHHNASKIPNFRGVISQAPAIRPAQPIPGPIKFAAKVLGTSVMPKFSQPNGLILSELCTDQAVIDAYKADPFNHDQITLRLARDIIFYGDELIKDAGKFEHPIIMYFSEVDKLTGFEGGKTFMDKVKSSDKTFKPFTELKHELHNEPSIKDQLIADYVAWILERSAAKEEAPAAAPAPVETAIVAETAVVAEAAAVATETVVETKTETVVTETVTVVEETVAAAATETVVAEAAATTTEAVAAVAEAKVEEVVVETKTETVVTETKVVEETVAVATEEVKAEVKIEESAAVAAEAKTEA
ncbi:hypothetical protein HDU97_009955 [Phlyctochytrium planicorne]|nr:hypothetical protein HDU97_009955 [Phlyctochytrium planicorne]